MQPPPMAVALGGSDLLRPSLPSHRAARTLRSRAASAPQPVNPHDATQTEAGERREPATIDRRGAYVMGRNMFGPIRGEWDEEWSGWWGPEPPYHAPAYVLTHHAHEPIEMKGGTTFHYVTEGFDAACARALEAAGEDGVDIAGGAATVRQALRAGVVDELWLDIAPVVLGSGESIFAGVDGFDLEPVEVLHSPLATHVRYRRAG